MAPRTQACFGDDGNAGTAWPGKQTQDEQEHANYQVDSPLEQDELRRMVEAASEAPQASRRTSLYTGELDAFQGRWGSPSHGSYGDDGNVVRLRSHRIQEPPLPRPGRSTSVGHDVRRGCLD